MTNGTHCCASANAPASFLGGSAACASQNKRRTSAGKGKLTLLMMGDANSLRVQPNEEDEGVHGVDRAPLGHRELQAGQMAVLHILRR